MDIQLSKFTGEAITPDRLKRALEIIEAAFRRWPLIEINVPKIDYLRWKLEYPGWAPNRLDLITVDGVEVYANLKIHRRFFIGGQPYRVREGNDSCTHPDFQGQGINRFYHMDILKELHMFDFGFQSTVNPHIITLTKKYQPGTVELGSSIKAFIRVIAPSAELAGRYFQASHFGLKRRILSAAISAAKIFGAIQSPKAPMNDRIEVRHIEDTDEILAFFDSLLKFISLPSGLFQERSREYIRWRYCDVRGGKAIFLFAFENDEPVGVAVSKKSEDIGSLMDLLTDPARQDVASELVAAVDNFFEREGAAAIVSRVLNDAPLKNTLRAHRYIRAPLQTGCQLYPALMSATELDDLTEGRSHHIMLGDFDWS